MQFSGPLAKSKKKRTLPFKMLGLGQKVMSRLATPETIFKQVMYNLDSELKSEYAGRNHSNLNEFPKIAKISFKNAKIIGNC